MRKPNRTGAAAHRVVYEVREFCSSHADPKRAERYTRFFVEGYDAYGVDTNAPEWGRQRQAWVGRLREAGPAAFLDAGDALVRSGKYEEASFAILFAADLTEYHTPKAFKRIEAWFDGGIRNWAHTDILAGEVLSAFLLQGKVALEDLERWRDSPFKFQRRAVPVTLIKLLKGNSDYSRLLAAIEPLMMDSEKVVQQGTGWFLRECWKREPKLTEEFLMKYKDSSPRIIFQYATEKMAPKDRQRFRRAHK
ncbi:MAG TPA: DNA alkylation repair protein [Bryobacteraceae bacterium]|nr:DNA alkylation repair protein [Bryobacteraceae bacterium]